MSLPVNQLQSLKSISQPALAPTLPRAASRCLDPRPFPPQGLLLCSPWHRVGLRMWAWRPSLLHFTSRLPPLGRQISEILGPGLLWLWLFSAPALLGPWRSERSHTRQTSDRAASGKPWPNYCSPGDCFNLLHNIVQRDRAHHITSCPRAAAITAPKIPPLPHTWHGPGWWDQATPTAPCHSERRLPGCPGW